MIFIPTHVSSLINKVFAHKNKNLLIILFGLYACSPSVGRIASAQNTPFNQDLVPLRTDYNSSLKMREKQNDTEDFIVDEDSLAIKKNNKDSIMLVYKEDSTMLYNSINAQMEMAANRKSWNGFSVQVYKGNSREQANRVKSLIYKHNIKLRPKMAYAMPYYRVRVGKYDEKYLAYPLYFSLKNIKELQRISDTRIVPIKVKN